MFAEGWKFIVVVVALNLSLSTLHFLLKTFKDKTESKLDDNLDELIERCLKVLEWVMGSARR